MNVRRQSSMFVVVLLIGMFGLTGCQCPPNCPPSPTFLTDIDDAFNAGDFDSVIQETSQYIETGEDRALIAESHLYRGLAFLNLEDLEAAAADLKVAESQTELLATIDPTYEQTLLYRGQMVLNARFGNIDLAERYLKQAVELSPELENEIYAEFEEALRQQ